MNESSPAPRPATSSGVRLPWRSAAIGLAIVLVIYLLTAYVVMPAWWERFERRHPALDAVPGITVTGDKHPGDPLNVALIGSEEDVRQALLAAGWFAADPLGLRSDLKIAADTVLKRPYDEAPVSNLFLFDRKEDLAFEQPVGDDPRQRHHVRFWKAAELDAEGRPLWIGSATYDKKVGLSHTTGQITHHIAAEVDVERDHLFENLQRAGRLTKTTFVDDFHKIREGKNGGGDPWRTDGRLAVGTLAPAGVR